MSLEAKICGITSEDAMAAARDHGASYVGFIFYPRSPRHISPKDAAVLSGLRGPAKAVAVTVDLPEMQLAALLDTVPIDMVQLHGRETPDYAAKVRERFRVPVMKSVAIAGPDDVARARSYEGAVDRLLFDAKPPKDDPDALPGGNAVSFDWRLLADESWSVPWMLSGGLTPDNVREATTAAGATAVDVSSGVESAPGVKDVTKIAAFLSKCHDS